MINTNTKYYGVINEDSLCLRSPRLIDSDECASLEEAFGHAQQMIGDGVSHVSIVRAAYSPKHEGWVELSKYGCIEINADTVADGFGLDDEEPESIHLDNNFG